MNQTKKLRLSFRNSTVPELTRVCFNQPISGEELCSVRGKREGALPASGTFQWTSAVRALMVLLLRHRVCREDVKLEGDSQSLAAALDYALSKPPVWLLEMFGTGSDGKTFARRLLMRSNPERKLPGPVVISVNARQLPSDEIEIFLDGKKCVDCAQIENLLERLEEHSNSTPRTAVCRVASQTSEPSSSPLDLRPMFRAEILQMLRATDIFTPYKLKEQLFNLEQKALGGREPQELHNLLECLDTELYASERLGMIDEATARRVLSEAGTLNIALPAVQVSSIAIFSNLKELRGYPFELDFRFPYATELIDRIFKDDFDRLPDICSIGCGAATRLLGRTDVPYSPVMLMPKISHRVVASRYSKSAALDYGEYHFVIDSPTTSLFYFDELEKKGLLKRKNTKVHHMEPDEASVLLNENNDPEYRSILWFPIYKIQEQLNGAKILTHPSGCGETQPSILFFHDRVMRNPVLKRTIKALLRSSWLELQSGGPALTAGVDALFGRSNFTEVLGRCTGIDRIPALESPLAA